LAVAGAWVTPAARLAWLRAAAELARLVAERAGWAHRRVQWGAPAVEGTVAEEVVPPGVRQVPVVRAELRPLSIERR
jgi:hypothetical protein